MSTINIATKAFLSKVSYPEQYQHWNISNSSSGTSERMRSPFVCLHDRISRYHTVGTVVTIPADSVVVRNKVV